MLYQPAGRKRKKGETREVAGSLPWHLENEELRYWGIADMEAPSWKGRLEFL